MTKLENLLAKWECECRALARDIDMRPTLYGEFLDDLRLMQRYVKELRAAMEEDEDE